MNQIVKLNTVFTLGQLNKRSCSQLKEYILISQSEMVKFPFSIPVVICHYEEKNGQKGTFSVRRSHCSVASFEVLLL